MGKTKVIHKTYTAYEYKDEIAFLNQESHNGWQLVNAGRFISKYEFAEDHTVEYRYQLDFNSSVNDKERYTDTFWEQGWEHIGRTFNGWHYFRKKYDSCLPTEEYEIYTDVPSKKEMTRRCWSRLLFPAAFIIGIILILCIVSAVMSFELCRLGIVLEMAVFEFIILGGAVRVKKVEMGAENKRKFPMGLLIGLGLAGYVFFILISMTKGGTTFTADQKINADTTGSYNTMVVKYPDFYYMDMEVSSDIRTAISVEDKNGDIIYHQQRKDFAVTNHRMLLRRGTYKIHIAYDQDQINGSEEKNSYIRYHID